MPISSREPTAEDYRTPALTCVEMPLEDLGRCAAELVIETPWDAPIRETLSAELTVSEGATVSALRSAAGSGPA